MSKLSEKSALDHKNAADFQRTATKAKQKEIDAKNLANKLDSEAKKLAQEAAKASGREKGRLEQMAKRAKQAANESRNLAEGFAEASSKAAAMAKALEIGTAVLDAMFTGLMKADEETAKLAKDVNLTKSEANGLRQEFAAVAFNSEELAITTSRLLTAFSALNDQLGTAQQFSMTTVGTFSKLT
jgi:chromosome segregation ATPase